MTKILFENLPSTNTPINAENLNKLNNVSVGIEEPTNNEELWVEHSNNLFDKNNVRANYRLDNSGNYYYNTGYNASENIKILPNTTYSTSWILSNMSCVCLYKKDGTFIQKIGDGIVKQFTTTNETSYIRVALTNEQLSSNIMLNKGSEALPYEPYVTPSIKANINGVYETIARPNVYSTEEQVIGTWIDGKPLYRKVYVTTTDNISFADIPFDFIHVDKCIAVFNNGLVLETGRNESGTDKFNYYINTQAKTVSLPIGSQWISNYIKGYIIIEYTKTID